MLSDEILAKRTYAQTAIFHVLMWCGSCGAARARYYRCLCSSLRTVSVVIASYSAHISYVEFFFWKDGGRHCTVGANPFFVFGSRLSCECVSRPVPLNSMLVSHRRSRMMLFSYFKRKEIVGFSLMGLLSHTLAHFTGPSFRLKTNNHYGEKN